VLKPKILAVYAKGGVDFWRTFQPCEAMRQEGLADIRLLDLRVMTGKDLSDGLRWADIISLRGSVSPEHLISLRQYQGLGKKVVTDHDDLFFNCSPFNKAYRQFGIEEIKVKNPETGDVQYLWKDGVEGFDLKRNIGWFHSYKACLQEADLVTTTTLYLKEAISEISEYRANVRVVPNAIDLTQWKPLEDVREKLPGKFRFGWAISNSHAEDFMFIKTAIQGFLKRHPDAVFVCMGDASVNANNAFPKDQFEWHPFSDLWEYHYPLRMAMLGLDAAIAPLADTEFNRCKSPLKFAEYTAFGWPIVAQDMIPYSDHIVHGETGLLAKTIPEWENCLDSLYANPGLRSKLRFNARITLNELFDLKKVAQEWAQVYIDLINGVLTHE
jgi:glycosyltransferase involved in cell wall biosynthesis